MKSENWLVRRLKAAASRKKLFSIFIPALLWGDLFEAQGADSSRVYRPTAAQLRVQQQQREREARIQAIRKQQKTAGVQTVRPVQQQNVLPAAQPVQPVRQVQPVQRVRLRYIWFKGSRFVLVQDIANFYGMSIVYSRGGLVLRSRRDTIMLQYDKRLAVINRVSVYLTHPPVLRGALVYLDEKDFLLSVDPVIRNAALWKHPVKTILIDPGHGGKDQGAPGVRGLLEKNITLTLGHKVAILLRKCGYRVFMTRIADSNLTLQQRVIMCERLKPDLFISIHCNAVGNRRTMGIETYAATPQGAASTSDSKPVREASAGNSFNRNNYRLAYEVQKNLLSFTSAPDRGVRHARFFVIRNAVCPAILIETGFVTHPQEGLLLNNSTYQEKLVNGIVSGVMAYTKASVPPGSPLPPAIQKAVPPAGRTVIPVVKPAGKAVVPAAKPAGKTVVPAVKPAGKTVVPVKKADKKPDTEKQTAPTKKAERKPDAEKQTAPTKKADSKPDAEKQTAPAEKSDKKPDADKQNAPAKKADTKPDAEKQDSPAKKADSKTDAKKQDSPAKKADSKTTADKPAAPTGKADTKTDADKQDAPAKKADTKTDSEKLDASAKKADGKTDADKQDAPAKKADSKTTADKPAVPTGKADSKKAVPAGKPVRKTAAPAKKSGSKTDAGKKSVR